MNNPRPTYSILPFRIKMTSGKYHTVPNTFTIYEHIGSDMSVCIERIHNKDFLNEVCKRGIPRNDAITLMYEMEKLCR